MAMMLEKAVHVYDDRVDRLEMARYYLEAELPNVLKSDSQAVRDLVHAAMERLSEKEVWRLLEAISFTFRMNGMFGSITSQALDWYRVEMPIAAITLTSLTPQMNVLLFSAQIRRDPLRLAAYLRSYFAEHINDDPQGLNDFRPRGEKLAFPVLFLAERRGEIQMYDGAHRLMVMAMQGATTVQVYGAVRNGRAKRRMVGDSAFDLLRGLYLRYRQPQDRKAILQVAALLARVSTDGEAAIESYWVAHPRWGYAKKVGRELLKRARERR